MYLRVEEQREHKLYIQGHALEDVSIVRMRAAARGQAGFENEATTDIVLHIVLKTGKITGTTSLGWKRVTGIYFNNPQQESNQAGNRNPAKSTHSLQPGRTSSTKREHSRRLC